MSVLFSPPPPREIFLYFMYEYCLDNSLKYDILITVKGDGCLNVENTRNCR